MINYVNKCITQAKTQLHSQGVGVGVNLDLLSKPVSHPHYYNLDFGVRYPTRVVRNRYPGHRTRNPGSP